MGKTMITKYNRENPTRIRRGLRSWLTVGAVAGLMSAGLVLGAEPALVPVGDSGNIADANGFGSVGYTYRIGVTEVTRGEYAAFLNAVAATDSRGLYNPSMGITQSGSPGSYTYAAVDGAKSVSFVSWYDALRYANWLHNGQPTGAQGAAGAENGAYAFSGTVTVGPRNPDARFFLPNEDEWYKAAYFQGGVDAFYWLYPTRSDAPPQAGTAPGNDNSANYDRVVGAATAAGAYVQAQGFYGTRDQAGNLWEWNETTIDGDRGLRGGSYDDYQLLLNAWYRDSQDPALDSAFVGFRIAAATDSAPVTTFSLVVNSGNGDGQYAAGTVVNITADAAPAGKLFDSWTGATVANALAAATTLTMPAAATAVTATYKDATFALTVQSGNGDGQYAAGTVVSIAAAAAPAGQVFDRWTGDVGAVANTLAANTTVTMPAAAVSITATYKTAVVSVTFDMTKAEWNHDNRELKVQGKGPAGKTVVVSYLSGTRIGSCVVKSDSKWELKVSVAPSKVPSHVRATCNGATDVMPVTKK